MTMKTTYDANILTYCQWRDDLTMEQSPFCHVDNLIFCCLAYLNWDGIAEGFTVSESVSLRDAAKLWGKPAGEGTETACGNGPGAAAAICCQPAFRGYSSVSVYRTIQ